MVKYPQTLQWKRNPVISGASQFLSRCQAICQSVSANISVFARQQISRYQPTCKSLEASISVDTKLSTGSIVLPSQNYRLFIKHSPLWIGQKYQTLGRSSSIIRCTAVRECPIQCNNYSNLRDKSRKKLLMYSRYRNPWAGKASGHDY